MDRVHAQDVRQILLEVLSCGCHVVAA
jgi:hypothetical protein